MRILESAHVIAVPDLAASSAFYREVLGFQVQEIGDPGWRLFVKDACRIMAGECRDATPPRETGDHSYFVYLVVDDVDAIHASVFALGAEITKPPRNQTWGMREFGLRTIDGHRIMVGQRVG
jgi:predicted enzyme related to lactoylglutathione lyase